VEYKSFFHPRLTANLAIAQISFKMSVSRPAYYVF